MLQIVRIILVFAFFFFCQTAFSQVVSEEEAIRLAVANYPSMKIVDAKIRQQSALQKTAFNPEQPEFIIETPTDVGLGYEVEQKFDFPTVYTSRSKWLKSQTRLVEQEAFLSRNDLIREVRLAYLEAQVANAELDYYTSQDSMWRQIAQQSDKLYEGGELNKAEQLFAQRQAGLASFNVINSTLNIDNAIEVLKNYTGAEVIVVDEIKPLPLQINRDGPFYFENLLASQLAVAENEIDVRKAERLPDLIFGYARNTEFETDYRYRLKGGITVPIWQGQYTGEVQSIKSEIELINAENELRLREFNLRKSTLLNRIEQTGKAIESFRENVLPQTDQLLDTYRRLYTGGQTDYTQTMKYIADASGTYLQYIEMLKQHNMDVIELEYLYGKS
ncbi:MAG TPA: TolC family protein [Saprospiraceae bacterium]|nr:TolC family protein [Saprospiraceae bacterium]